MKIGIELIDLYPKINQGINVYSENLVENFLKLNKKTEIQLYVNDAYYLFAKNRFKSKNLKIFVYKHQYSKIKNLILKTLILLNFITPFSYKKLYFIFKNFFYRDLKNLVENNSEILVCPNVILNYYSYNIKSLLCIHDVQHEYLKENFSKYDLSERKITRNLSVDNCDYLIASSNYLKKQCHKYYEKKKSHIKVIEEGVNLDLFKKIKYKNRIVRNFNLPNRYLFYPAAFWPHKNHLFLLKALKKMSRNKVNLILCGLKKNYFSQVNKYISENNLKDNVKYLGNLSLTELIKVYRHSTAVIIPSLEESSCLLLKETVGFKKPLICSDTETFKEKSKIFKIDLYKKNSVDALQKKIMDIFINKKIKKKNIIKNFRILKNYEWKKVVDNYFLLCKKII